MTKYFINHPIPAIVLSIILVLFGILAALKLPVAEFPNISPPTISVSASYIGADTSVVNDTVAQIIEEQIKGIDGFDYMTSNIDTAGNYNLTIIFKKGTNEDNAAVQVQNKIQTISAELPETVRNAGINVTKGSSDISFMVSFTSPNGKYDSLFLRTYAEVYFMDKIRRISGVGATEFYTGDYAMRIWINPDKAAKLGLTVNDIENAIKEQTTRPAIGSVGKLPVKNFQEKEFIGRSQDLKENPADFENIIVRNDNGVLIRLKDFAKVDEGARSFDFVSFENGSEVANLSISLTSSANTLETISNVKKILEDSKKDFPPDMEYKIVLDPTIFINEALQEIFHTFIEAFALVIIIVLIFLQNFRAAIISLLAIPISLTATFIFFPILGFTLNTLTLFAMILAIGLVVDDAIVVIEIVERNLESGMEVKDATISAMEEVQKPIIAIACVLSAVFIPVAMIEGITGEIYRQFSLTIVISMALSSFVALSLTPALCVLILKKRKIKNSAFNKFFAKVENIFKDLLKIFMQRKLFAIIFLILFTAGTFQLYKILPTEYVPNEDKGNIFVGVTLPEGSSINRTIATVNKISSAINKIDSVELSSSDIGFDLIGGGSKSNAGTIFVVLKDWSERTKNLNEVIEEITEIAEKIAPEANIMAMSASGLPGLDTIGGISMRLLNVKNLSDIELDEIAKKIVTEAKNFEEIESVEVTFNLDKPYIDFKIDEEKAKILGVNLEDIYKSLRVNFGGEEVADFTKFGRNYKIILQADKNYRSEFESAKFIFVKNSAGVAVPLDTLVTLKNSTGAGQITRFNGVRSLNFEGIVAQGYSSGTALNLLEKIVEENAPNTFQIEWAGISRQEKLAESETAKIFWLSLVFVFLCLVALYENWTIPFAILLSIPSGIFGVIFAEILTNNANSIYTQIGILVIIGLTAKNAILIVEFAKDRILRGEKTFDATINAAVIRLRPILMTSLAFIVACIPLAVASGAGSSARNGIGAAVVGGMFFATIIGIFIVPVLFKIISDRDF